MVIYLKYMTYIEIQDTKSGQNLGGRKNISLQYSYMCIRKYNIALKYTVVRYTTNPKITTETMKKE